MGADEHIRVQTSLDCIPLLTPVSHLQAYSYTYCLLYSTLNDIRKMAPQEMIQKGRNSSQTPFSTPPDSPVSQPLSHLTPIDPYQFVEMVKAIASIDTPHNTCSHAPEGTTPHTTPLTMEHLEKLIEKLMQAKPQDSASKEAKSTASGDAKPKEARASKLAFKAVNEMYVSS